MMGSPAAPAAGHKGKSNNSTPRHLWTSRDNADHLTTGNKRIVAGMVAEKLFYRAKFVDCNVILMCDEKFVTTSYNLQANIDMSTY
jgi:hypothetical protein